MKRNIIYTLLLAAALVFSACGSDSKIDPIAPIVDPTDPSDPTLPTDPTDPSDPTLPTDPTDPSIPVVDTTNYNFIALTNEINVSTGGSSRVLDLYLNDTTTLRWVEGQAIIAYAFDPNTGVLNEYTTTTDANGHVAFNYTAPEILPIGTSLTITFAVDGGVPALTETVVVNFVSDVLVPPVDTTNYNLIAVPADINISTVDTSRVLDLYLADTSVNAPVAGQVITAQFVDPNKGTLNQYTATTDATGHVAFNYTRPETFTVGDTFDITFEVAGGTVPKIATVGVTFVDVNTAPSVDTTNYVLIPVPTAINISTVDTSRVLDLYLADTSVNAPVAGQVITAQFVDPNKGTLNQYTATTDATGHVAFNYTRPETVPVNTSFDITFEVLGGTVTKQATVSVAFVDAPFNYTLENETTPIIVTYATQEHDISVYVVDSSNVGVPGKDLNITIVADGYGSVSSSSATTDAGGKATFTYTAPDNIDSLVGTNTTVTLSFTENGTTISTNVVIMISSVAILSDYSLVNPAPTADINSTNPIAVLDIQLIHTVDGNEIPVIDARPCTIATNRVTIDCVIPEVIPREYGRIINAAGSNEGDGYIYFDFEGPVSGIPGFLEFDVYYIDENGEIAATNTLSVDVNIP